MSSRTDVQAGAPVQRSAVCHHVQEERAGPCAKKRLPIVGERFTQAEAAAAAKYKEAKGTVNMEHGEPVACRLYVVQCFCGS